MEPVELELGFGLDPAYGKTAADLRAMIHGNVLDRLEVAVLLERLARCASLDEAHVNLKSMGVRRDYVRLKVGYMPCCCEPRSYVTKDWHRGRVITLGECELGVLIIRLNVDARWRATATVKHQETRQHIRVPGELRGPACRTGIKLAECAEAAVDVIKPYLEGLEWVDQRAVTAAL